MTLTVITWKREGYFLSNDYPIIAAHYPIIAAHEFTWLFRLKGHKRACRWGAVPPPQL
jgi:hypothetical protein